MEIEYTIEPSLDYQLVEALRRHGFEYASVPEGTGAPGWIVAVLGYANLGVAVDLAAAGDLGWIAQQLALELSGREPEIAYELVRRHGRVLLLAPREA